MMFDACCKMMNRQLNMSCSEHDNLADCPDAIIVVGRNGEYRLPIHDGGSSSFVAHFCPWCGSDLGVSAE